MRSIILLALLCVIALPQEKQLSPREIFYSPPPSAKSAAKKARPTDKPMQPTALAPKPEAPAGVPEAGAAPAPSDSPVKLVSTEARRPLGLRYSILKRTESGEREVDPDTAFHAGDRIRLSIESNDAGHLYVVNRGSSGAWNVLFPSPEIAGGDNRIKPGVRYEIPSGYTFTFDEHAGEERLFIVLSRQPEPDLEKLIYSLGESGGKPAVKPDSGKLMLAANITPIDDLLVGRLRKAYARDLIIEKVDDTTPGSRAEKAVYAVNTSGGADARVVADVTLTHR